jgi:glycerate dehydrogenase
MPHIVYLDSYTLNPGDLSWKPLRALGECVFYDRTPDDQVIQRAAEAEILLTNKVVLEGPTIRTLPRVRYIGVTATGYNIIDLAAAQERNVVVTSVPAYSTRSVAQMTLALLLELTHHVGQHARSVCGGRWSASPDFCLWERPLLELAGLTMGIVGLGQIGREVAQLAQVFGMNLVAASRQPPNDRIPLILYWSGYVLRTSFQGITRSAILLVRKNVLLWALYGSRNDMPSGPDFSQQFLRSAA